MRKKLYYLFMATILYMIVDFFSAFQDIKLWLNAWYLFWIYLSLPLLFYYLFYKRGWSDKKALLLLIVITLLMEIFLFGNIELSWLAVFLYAAAIYIPKWYLDGQLAQKRGWIIILVTVCIFSFLGKAFWSN